MWSGLLRSLDEEVAREERARAAALPGLTVKLLGTPEVCDAHGEPVPIRGDVARRVFVYLLLAAPHVIPNHRLIEAVWEGEAPESAIDQIRKTISRLRRELPSGTSLIRTEPGGYRIVVDPRHIDLTRWREAIQHTALLEQNGDCRGALETLSAGLELWRGRALDGLDGQSFVGESVALQEERNAALETWCRLALEELGSSTVIARLRREITQDPLQERMWDTLIRVLASSGRPLEAMEEYNRMRKILAESLRVRPSASLQGIYRRLEAEVGGRPAVRVPLAGPARPASRRKVPLWIMELLRGQEPVPAYVLDKHWNVLHRNQAMSRWFPWLRGESANLLRWALLDPSARTVLHNWDEHAMVYLGVVHSALRKNPDDAFFTSLEMEAENDPKVSALLIEGHVVEVASRSGHRFTLGLPHITPEPLEVVAHVLCPEGKEGLRVVVLSQPTTSLEENVA